MIKSTASAGPVQLQSSPSAYYLWEFPEKPVSVRLSLDVVDRLERDVLESFRAITARGSEVGGLLLGRAEPGEKLQAIVENYELFHCDYTRGPLYLLSEEEKTRMEDAIRRKKSIGGQGGAVVGFFRSNTRKDLALDDEDLEIYGKYFSRPEQVFLMIKPYAAKPSAAGIFIWEGGKVRNEGSYIEFPFRRGELGKGQWAKSIVHDAPEPKEIPVDTAPAPIHKTGSRAPVLPFSLKRDEEAAVPVPPLKREERAPVVALSPKPEEAKPVVAPIAPKPADPVPAPVERKAPAAPKAAAEPVESAKREEKKPAVKKEEIKVEAAAPVKAEPPQMEKPEKMPAASATSGLSILDSPTKVDPLPARSVFGGKKLWALFGGLTMLGLAGGTLYYLKSHSDASSSSMVREGSSFQLKAEPSNGQLLVSWNRNAAIIKTAQSAVLSISDGAKTEDVPLDLTQLHTGSIMYSPLSGDVSFRLEVRGSSDGKSRSEFVRGPLTTPAQTTDSATAPGAAKPTQTPQAQAVPQQAQQQTKVAEAARSDEASRPAEETQAQPPQRTAAPPKPFSLAARIHQPEPTDLPEAPGVDVSGTPSVIRPALPGRLPAPPPAAPPAQAQTTAPVPAQPQSTARVGGKVQEPKLLRRVDAIYPPMARQARVGGVVRLQATIGKDGKIRKLEVLSGPPLLKQAAIDAVQKWVYSPSLLNGSPVESTTDVDVNFNLNSR